MTTAQKNNQQPQKKKHHYIPKTYLENFTDESKKLFFYRKDDAANPVYTSTDNIAHRRYYYSQPTPDGGQDNNALEDTFSEIEGHWKRIVETVRTGRDLKAEREYLYPFIALLRVRVPAARDHVEFMQAGLAKMTMRQLDGMGELPSKPDGFEDILDHAIVSIDPHQSIHAMPHMMKGFGALMSFLGYRLIKNKTGIPLITSDNPVIVLDPDVAEDKLQPYRLRPNGRAEIILPVDPWHMLHGHTDYRPPNGAYHFSYKDCHSLSFIKRANRMTARFAYEAVYASTQDHAVLIEKHAKFSPVPDLMIIPQPGGQMQRAEWKFGERLKKPKWEAREERVDAW